MLELGTNQTKQLLRILDNALDNSDLFTSIDRNDEEVFDPSFYSEIKEIRNRLSLTIEAGSEF